MSVQNAIYIRQRTFSLNASFINGCRDVKFESHFGFIRNDRFDGGNDEYSFRTHNNFPLMSFIRFSISSFRNMLMSVMVKITVLMSVNCISQKFQLDGFDFLLIFFNCLVS